MLKFKVDAEQFGGLDEAQQSMYKQEGDSYVLQVEGAVDKSKLDEFRSNNVELLKQLDQYKGIDLEEYSKMTEQQRKLKEKELIDAGEIDTLFEQRLSSTKSDYEAKLEKLQNQLNEKDGAYQSTVQKYEIDGAAQKAFSAHKVSPEAQDFVLAKIRSTFKVNEGKAVAFDGEEIIKGENGNLTIDEFVGSLPDSFKVPSSGGRASGANGGPSVGQKLTSTQRIAKGLSALR